MAVGNELRLSYRQRLSLTPQMRQALGILRMPAQDLAALIAETAADNPFLEASHPSAAPDRIGNLAAGPPSLFATLAGQIATLQLDDCDRAALAVLVEELREDGYLDRTLEEVAEQGEVPLAALERALALLQRLEPPGVGARDLAECLALQLVARGEEPAQARRICARLEDFAEGRWRPLMRDLGLPEARLRQLGALLPTLPASPWQPDETLLLTRIPDLVVTVGSDGMPQVRLNPDALPRLRLNPLFAGASPELARLHGTAEQLQQAIAARCTTLMRIGERIAARQARYFASNGEEPLAPCTRSELAADLSVHATTIGRAVRDKALLFNAQTLPLRNFFSQALSGGGQPVSAHHAQRRIRALIAAEAEGAPLADEAIRAQLQREGVDIARRTVAKYRQRMRISSSFGRRRRGFGGTTGPRAVRD